jgi:hypothetical protein
MQKKKYLLWSYFQMWTQVYFNEAVWSAVLGSQWLLLKMRFKRGTEKTIRTTKQREKKVGIWGK